MRHILKIHPAIKEEEIKEEEIKEAEQTEGDKKGDIFSKIKNVFNKYKLLIKESILFIISFVYLIYLIYILTDFGCIRKSIVVLPKTKQCMEEGFYVYDSKSSFRNKTSYNFHGFFIWSIFLTIFIFLILKSICNVYLSKVSKRVSKKIKSNKFRKVILKFFIFLAKTLICETIYFIFFYSIYDDIIPVERIVNEYYSNIKIIIFKNNFKSDTFLLVIIALYGSLILSPLAFLIHSIYGVVKLFGGKFGFNSISWKLFFNFSNLDIYEWRISPQFGVFVVVLVNIFFEIFVNIIKMLYYIKKKIF